MTCIHQDKEPAVAQARPTALPTMKKVNEYGSLRELAPQQSLFDRIYHPAFRTADASQ